MQTDFDEMLHGLADLASVFKEPRATVLKMNRKTWNWFLHKYAEGNSYDYDPIHGASENGMDVMDVMVDDHIYDGAIFVIDQYDNVMKHIYVEGIG